MNVTRVVIVCGFLAAWNFNPTMGADTKQFRQRRFQLSYEVTVTGVAPGKEVKVWLPVPPNNTQQRVHVIAQNLPGPSRQGRESKFGNDILHVEAIGNASGGVALSLVYDVTRNE